MLAGPAHTPRRGQASSPPLDDIGADMPRCTSRNIRGEPWEVWKILKQTRSRDQTQSLEPLIVGGRRPLDQENRGPDLLRFISGCLPKVRKFQTLQNYPVEVVREPKWKDSVCVFPTQQRWVGRRMHHILPQPAFLSLAYPR